jgi:hypothetical protein
MSRTYNLAQSQKLLRVDTKTFNKWLEKAKITPEQDAYDTRQKLLTYEQLVMLADLHKRPRPSLPEEAPSEEEVTLTTLDKRLTTLEQLIIQRLDALTVNWQRYNRCNRLPHKAAMHDKRSLLQCQQT